MNEQHEVPEQPVAHNEKKVPTKTWIIITGIIAVAILVVGNMYSKERMAERAIEQAFEAQGIHADIGVGDAGTFEYAATGETGENISVSAGEHVSLPKGWPSNVPMPSDAKLTYAGTVAGNEGETNYMVSYSTTQSLTDISTFYSDAFAANGWGAVSNVMMGDSIMLGVEYGEKNSVGVYAVKEATGVAVTLTVSARE